MTHNFVAIGNLQVLIEPSMASQEAHCRMATVDIFFVMTQEFKLGKLRLR